MKIEDFNARVRDAILVADGAMGALLYGMVGPQRSFEELSVTQPELIYGVHQSYIEAGAQIIETNTFSANRHKLAPLGLSDQVGRMNSAAVKIAREARDAAAREVFHRGLASGLRAESDSAARFRTRNCGRAFANKRRRWKSAAWIFSFSRHSAISRKSRPPSKRFASSPFCRSSPK